MSSKLFKFRPFELVKENPAKNSFMPGPRSGKRSEKSNFRRIMEVFFLSGHRICCDSNNLYVYGGYNFQENTDSHNLYKEILCYNFVSKTWRLNNDDDDDDDCPDELASSSMLMYGKTLVVFGGTSYPFGMRCSNRVTLISLNSAESYRIQELITLNDEMNQPPGQYGMSTVCKDNYLYTVGGTQGFDYTADIFRFVISEVSCADDVYANSSLDSISRHRRGSWSLSVGQKSIRISQSGDTDMKSQSTTDTFTSLAAERLTSSSTWRFFQYTISSTESGIKLRHIPIPTKASQSRENVTHWCSIQ